MSQWQDISTAPKDGTYIQLWRGPVKGFGSWEPLVYGRWFEFEDDYASWAWPEGTFDLFTDEGRHDADYAIGEGDCWDDDKNFTHWMPLPSPPSLPLHEGSGS